MKKMIICILFILTMSSCTLLGVILDIDTVASKDKDDDIRGNVQIYVNNKTFETLLVFAKGFNNDIELARITKEKIQKINVRKGIEIYIIGGTTQRKYREIICNTDQETFVIY